MTEDDTRNWLSKYALSLMTKVTGENPSPSLDYALEVARVRPMLRNLVGRRRFQRTRARASKMRL